MPPRGGTAPKNGAVMYAETANAPSADQIRVIGDLTYTGYPVWPTFICETEGYGFAGVKSYKKASGEEVSYPKDAGDYIAEAIFQNDNETYIVEKPFTISKGKTDKSRDFSFYFKGQLITNSVTVTYGEDSLADISIYFRNDLMDKEDDWFKTVMYDADGNQVEQAPTALGTYHYTVKVKFLGDENWKPNDDVATWDYTYIVKPITSDFTVSEEMEKGFVYDGTSHKPELLYDKEKYKDANVKFEYYIQHWGYDSPEPTYPTVENPTDAGTYYVRAIVNGETLENKYGWQFNIERAPYDASKFHATLDGQTVEQTDVPELELATNKLMQLMYNRFEVSYDGQEDISSSNFTVEAFTEDGNENVLYENSPYIDENNNLKAGTYLLKLYFIGSQNLDSQQRNENYEFLEEPLYRCKLTVTSPEDTTEIKDIPYEDGVYYLQAGGKLNLPEEAEPVNRPLVNFGTIQNGKFAEMVEGGTINGGTFNEIKDVEKISGGVFAQEPETGLTEGVTVSNPVDQLKVVDLDGAPLNDSCTINDVIGAKTNGVAVMALFAENSTEADPMAYVVGSGNKITVKNADTTHNVKQWIVDLGTGKPQVFNGETASFSVDASDKTVTVTAVFEGQESPIQPEQPSEPEQPGTPNQPSKPEQPGTPNQPSEPEQPGTPEQPSKPEQPGTPNQPSQPDQPDTPDQPEEKEPEYTITVEDGQINGKASATVKAGDTVSLTVGEVPESMAFLYWDIPTELMQALTEQDVNFNNKAENLTFKMPKLAESAEKSFTIRAAFGTAETADDGDYSALGVVTGVVAGGAAATVVGWQLYNIGTDLYLQAVLPKGAAIPTNRQELALLLWQNAGKPEAVTASYADIANDQTDAQKAARWAVANGLLDAAGEDATVFAPAKSVSRLTVIKAWNKAQKLKKQ